MSLFIKLSFLLLLAFHLDFAAAATNQFQKWYPEFGKIFDKILHENCSVEYERYLTLERHSAPVHWFTGGTSENRLIQPVILCIMNSSSEVIRANMASAAVVLGLTPMILATVGNSVEETSVLCVVAKRPLLALCLAAGSPAVSPFRSFEYFEPWNLLRDRAYRLRPIKFRPGGEFAIVALEYILAAAVIANTITLCNQLGLQVSCVFAPDLTYLPLLWSILGISIHCSGALALLVRTVSVRDVNHKSVFRLLKQQFQPMDNQITADISFRKESYIFVFISWFTSLLNVCYVIYGTLTFSSMLFISVRDSMTVIARYMASALMCRVILMYKLSLLRDYHNAKNGDRIELLNRIPSDGGHFG